MRLVESLAEAAIPKALATKLTCLWTSPLPTLRFARSSKSPRMAFAASITP